MCKVTHFMMLIISIFRWFLIAISTVVFGSLLVISGSYKYVVLWGKMLLFFSGSKLIVKGEVPKGHYIIISNHLSYLDIPAIIAALSLKLSWLTKSSLFHIPFLSSAMRKCGNVAVDRSNVRSKALSLLRIVRQIKKGKNFVIFPEGTRHSTDLKDGAFWLAKKSMTKLLPLRINGTDTVLPAGGFIFHPGKISITIGKPLDYSADIKEKVKEILNG